MHHFPTIDINTQLFVSIFKRNTKHIEKQYTNIFLSIMFVHNQVKTALKNSYLHMQIPGTHTSASSFTFSSFYKQASKQM